MTISMRRAWLLAAVLMAFGVGQTLAQGEAARDAGWVAPAKDASKKNPLASRPDAAAGGQKIFQQRCASCHGDDGRGTLKGPDLSVASTQEQSDGALFWKIGSGNSRTGMPGFSFVPELQRWQLVLHLRAVARQ